MEIDVSGFKVEGDWQAVVEHGERVTRALLSVDLPSRIDPSVHQDALAEWEAWRPRPDDSLDKEISQKTADQAVISRGAGERADTRPTEDLQQAGRKLIHTLERLDQEGLTKALSNVGHSLGHAARAADSVGRKVLRRVERVVYERVMTQVAPYFFDNRVISAHIERTSNGDGQRFLFEIDINDDQLKRRVTQWLRARSEASLEAAPTVQTPARTD